MQIKVVPVRYEEDISAWLRNHFPLMDVLAVVEIDQHAFHIFVADTNAVILCDYLVKDIIPPFTRRTLDLSPGPQSKYEPGLIFGYLNFQQPEQSLRVIATAYRSAIPDLKPPVYEYVQKQLIELNSKISDKVARGNKL